MNNRSAAANASHSNLLAVIVAAANGETPEEPEFLGSWLPNIPDSQFEIVAHLIGDKGEAPALAGLADSGRRALLCRVAGHLRSMQ